MLLIEDGVYAGQDQTQYSQLISDSSEINFYALEADVNARGLSQNLAAGITLVSDSEFVELAVKHSNVQSWF